MPTVGFRISRDDYNELLVAINTTQGNENIFEWFQGALADETVAATGASEGTYALTWSPQVGSSSNFASAALNIIF